MRHGDGLFMPPYEPPHSGYMRPPLEFVDAANEFRLIPMLRGAARTRDPELILAWSATEFFNSARAQLPREKQAAQALGTALADLAATGREAYTKLQNGVSLLKVEGNTRLRIEARMPPRPATDAEIADAMTQALDRAFLVAWALRGPISLRQKLRAGLGWIAVSGEDDAPHRPVNIPAPPYEQYEFRVPCPIPGGRTISLATRFIVALADPPGTTAAARLPRATPDDRPPNIPPDHKIILFLHGHSSGAEEALEIIPHILRLGLDQGIKFAVVSFDLPNNGYSESFDHTRIAPLDATTFPVLPPPVLPQLAVPIATPVLDFIEDFVVAFVDSLERVAIQHPPPRIQERVVGVIGGSLGGNLGLRLGRRKNMPDWLKHTIVAWSPASVWKAKVAGELAEYGARNAWEDSGKVETDGSRREYFAAAYDTGLARIVKAQPENWYRDDFSPRAMLIALSRVARHEIYNPFFRQWHWRVACEQLIYSHAENEVYGDASTPIRYTLNTVNTLLAAGENDHPFFADIFDGTQKIGRAMVRTPGRLLLLRDTGHAIHIERPQYWASEIVDFVAGGPARSMEIKCVTRRAGRIIRVGGFDHTAGLPFDLTQQEVIAAIGGGDAFYVVDADGNAAAVIVGQMHVEPGPFGQIRYYIKTEADDSEPNNLGSLPAC